MIARILGCARSTVYRVAAEFLTHGIEGLVDGREDNGDPKVDEDYVVAVLVAVSGSPSEFGYQRTTWTQELLVLVAARETGIQIRTSTRNRDV